MSVIKKSVVANGGGSGGGGGAVDSVFSRTGNVVAVLGDYDASEITSSPFTGISATDVQAALEQVYNAIPAVTGFVPYTGANAPVNLGENSLTAAGVYSTNGIFQSAINTGTFFTPTSPDSEVGFTFQNNSTVYSQLVCNQYSNPAIPGATQFRFFAPKNSEGLGIVDTSVSLIAGIFAGEGFGVQTYALDSNLRPSFTSSLMDSANVRHDILKGNFIDATTVRISIPYLTASKLISTDADNNLVSIDSSSLGFVPYEGADQDLNLGSNSLTTAQINGVNNNLNAFLGVIPSGNEGRYRLRAEANGQQISIVSISANFADSNPSTTTINPNTLNDEPNSSVKYIFGSPSYNMAETQYILNADTSGEAVYSIYDDTQTLKEVLRLKADRSSNFSGIALSSNFVSGAQRSESVNSQTYLSATSSFYQEFFGTDFQIAKLPNATTLQGGHAFLFINNSTGDLDIRTFNNEQITVIPTGARQQFQLSDNSTSSGVWNVFSLIPANITWGTNQLKIPFLNSLQLLATDTDKNIQSLSTEEYPSLEEISYVKGATSNLQAQITNIENESLQPYSESFSDQNSFTVNHNLGRRAIAIQVFNSDGELINVGVNNDDVNYFTIYCEAPLTISGFVNYL